MAFAFVRTNTYSDTATTHNITVTSTTQGNLLVVSFDIGSATATITSVTDNQGNSYGLSIANVGDTMWQYHGVQVTGGVTTVTVTLGSSTGLTAYIEEFSGGASTNAAVFDKASSGTGTGTSGAVTSQTPADDGSLVAVFITFADTVTGVTAGANYTLTQTVFNAAGEYRLSSSGAETSPITWTTSRAWKEVAGVYKVLPPSVVGDDRAYFM